MLEMEIVSPAGQRLIIRSTDNVPVALRDDDIFNHFDDDVKIRQFMAQVNRK